MQRFKKMSKDRLSGMFLAHLVRFPAIRVIFGHLVKYPKAMYGIGEEEIEANLRELIRGLVWKKDKK